MLRRGNDRAIAAALIVSVLVHLAALLRLPPFEPKPPEDTRHGDVPSELSVQIVRPPPRRPPVVAESRPAPSPAPPPPRRAQQSTPPPRPPVLASKEPAPRAPSVPPPAPQRSAPASPPATDLASFVEAQRRARGETAPAEPTAAAPAQESANARANRIASANLSAGSPLTFGYDPRRSGGVFQVTRQTLDYAEFMFFGWNRDARRNTAYVIPVNRQNAPDIRIAIVRKMISIIRDYEQADFVWESQRLGRNVTLSARQRDTAGLEDFLLQEFFPDWRRP